MDLKNYFTNDRDCCFDELVRTGISPDEAIANLNTTDLGQNIDSSTFSEILENMDSFSGIPEDVKNFWLPACFELGLPPMLTMPGVQITEDQLTDSIQDVVVSHLGNEEIRQRKILRVDDVTQDERGLRILISSGCYRAAVSLSSRLLTIYGQGKHPSLNTYIHILALGFGRAGQPTKHSPHSLQLWFTRLTLLVKLRQYELLQSEAEAFDNLTRRDVYYEFYPSMYNGKTGCMGSFALRLLLAVVPMYTNKSKEALDTLCEIAGVCNEIKSYFKQQNFIYSEFWRKREIKVLCTIINCAIEIRDYGLIDEVLSKILLQTDTRRCEKRWLLSACGRIYLQAGDVFGAEFMFAEARRLKDKNLEYESLDTIEKGLTAVAQNDFVEAFSTFQKALKLDPTNIMVLNNMGVCQLYSGKLKNAITWFEKSVDINPPKALNEHLLINLATLYELQSSTSRDKKLSLLRLLNSYKPDLSTSLDICLKLQSNY